MSVLIVSGLKREAAILSGPGRLAICGDGPTLRAGLAELEDTHFDLVISWGRLRRARLRGSVLAISSWARKSSRPRDVGADEAVMSSLARRLIDAGTGVDVERVAAVSSPVSTASAKADLRIAGGAAAVDMESLPPARFALEQRTPFAILRAVADPAERDLPPLLLDAVNSTAGSRLPPSSGSFSALLASSPGLSRRLATARPRSGRCRCRGLLPGLFLGLGPANLESFWVTLLSNT